MKSLQKLVDYDARIVIVVGNDEYAPDPDDLKKVVDAVVKALPGLKTDDLVAIARDKVRMKCLL